MSSWLKSTSPFMMPVWAMLGSFDTEAIEEKVLFGAPLMWVYTLIVTVVLVNLLVAMFSDTYTRIKVNGRRIERARPGYARPSVRRAPRRPAAFGSLQQENSEREYCHLRYVFVYSYRNLADPLPPPFNLPLALFRLAASLTGRAARAGSASAMEEIDHWRGAIENEKISLTELYLNKFLERQGKTLYAAGTSGAQNEE